MEKQDCDRYNNPFISHIVHIKLVIAAIKGCVIVEFISHIVHMKHTAIRYEKVVAKLFISHVVQIKL